MKGTVIEQMLDNRLDLSKYYTVHELSDLIGLDASELSYKMRRLDVEGTVFSIMAGTKAKPRRAYKVNPDNKFFKCIVSKRSRIGIDDSELLMNLK